MALHLALAVLASSAVAAGSVAVLASSAGAAGSVAVPNDVWTAGGGIHIEKNCVALGNVLMCDGAKNQCAVPAELPAGDVVEVDSFEAGAAKAPSAAFLVWEKSAMLTFKVMLGFACGIVLYFPVSSGFYADTTNHYPQTWSICMSVLFAGLFVVYLPVTAFIYSVLGFSSFTSRRARGRRWR